jgi:putative transcriptional regulator
MTKKKYVGHLLIANPNNPRDELSKSVMLLVTHTAQNAIGLQINNAVDNLNLKVIADRLNIQYLNDDPLYHGGNIGTHQIHVVHSSDWKGVTTVQLTENLSVTNDISVIAALVQGEGPRYFRACAGYCAWSEGKLDQQLNPKYDGDPYKWEVVPATLSNVFELEGADQWRSAIDESAQYQVDSWL